MACDVEEDVVALAVRAGDAQDVFREGFCHGGDGGAWKAVVGVIIPFGEVLPLECSLLGCLPTSLLVVLYFQYMELGSIVKRPVLIKLSVKWSRCTPASSHCYSCSLAYIPHQPPPLRAWILSNRIAYQI